MSVFFRPTSTPGGCEVYASMAGFAPDTDYSVMIGMGTPVGPPTGGPIVSAHTDSQGSATVLVMFISDVLVLHFSAGVDDVTSPWVALDC